MRQLLVILGYLLIVFALVDLGCFYFADIDITGSAWSAYISGAVGGVLIKIFGDD